MSVPVELCLGGEGRVAEAAEVQPLVARCVAREVLQGRERLAALLHRGRNNVNKGLCLRSSLDLQGSR